MLPFWRSRHIQKINSKSKDENEFLFLVNNLVMSKGIWKMIEEIGIFRNQIKDKIKNCNKIYKNNNSD